MSFQIGETGRDALGDNVTLNLADDGDGAKMFVRNAVRMNGGAVYPTLVAELDGVRAYVRERAGKVHVLMTKADLYE